MRGWSRRVLAILLTAGLAVSGCTGGEETAAQTQTPSKDGKAAPQPIDPRERLAGINPAIPVYTGAAYNGDLSRRDNLTVANRYGDEAAVYTLATEDSFPQVWHYYVTYLAQFRQFEPLDPFPPSNQVQRTMEVRLNQVMRDPFVPGDAFDPGDRDVILQVVENDAGEGTIIRYIVRPPSPQPSLVASTAGPAAPTTAAP
jgi:hypothetical protein